MDMPALIADPAGGVIVGSVLRSRLAARVVSARAATAEGDAPEESGHAAVWNDRDRPGTAPRGGGVAFVGVGAGSGDGVAVGVNAAGIHALGDTGAAAGDADAGAQLGRMTRRILEQAVDPAAAAALAAAELREARLPGASIHVAAAGRAVSLTLAGRDIRVDDTTASLRTVTAAWPRSILDRVSSDAAAPRPGRAPVVGALATRLGPARPEVLICLGPPQYGVAIRYWPGIDVAPQTAELGDLAARLAEAVHARPPVQVDVDRALVTVRAAVLEEGNEAARLAAIMDRDGDDRGAEVRRGVAQFHALELALDALRDLLERLHAAGVAGGPSDRPDL